MKKKKSTQTSRSVKPKVECLNINDVDIIVQSIYEHNGYSDYELNKSEIQSLKDIIKRYNITSYKATRIDIDDMGNVVVNPKKISPNIYEIIAKIAIYYIDTIGLKAIEEILSLDESTYNNLLKHCVIWQHANKKIAKDISTNPDECYSLFTLREQILNEYLSGSTIESIASHAGELFAYFANAFYFEDYNKLLNSLLNWIKECRYTQDFLKWNDFMDQFIKKVNSFHRNNSDVKVYISNGNISTRNYVATISWENITFIDKHITIKELPPKLYSGVLPKTISIEKSKATFNCLKDYFIERMPGLNVVLHNGEITKFENLKQFFDLIKTLQVQNTAIELPFLNKIPRGIGILLNQTQINNLIKEFNSASLNYLSKKQLKEYNILHIIENRRYSEGQYYEDAFIFTISDYNDMLHIVYENAYEKNASISVRAHKTDYDEIVEILNDYFSSPTMNKRQCMHVLHNILRPISVSSKRVIHSSEWRYNL